MSSNWFIALAVDAGEWFRAIPPEPPDVRKFGPGDLHVTVAFLGPVGQERAEAAFEIAAQWPTGRVDITLGAVTSMGNPRRPSAFAAMVAEGREEIVLGTVAVRQQMWERAGARANDRLPVPHVTIARLKRSASKTSRAAAVVWARGIELGSPRLTVSRLVLFTHAEDRRERLFREHRTLDLALHPAQTR